MKYLGNLTEDQVIDFHFSTHKADGTPITLGGTPAVKIYRANATDSEATAGVTLDVDFDGVTGLHHVRIDTSTDAFYSAANDYSVVITAGTVDSVSVVGTVLATFSIENRFNESNVTQVAGTAQTAGDIIASIATIGSCTGAALNFAVSEDNASAPIKSVSSVGTQTGTYANTLANDGTVHSIASVANAIDWIYGFSVGAGRAASKVVLRASMGAVGDTVTVQAYNFTTTAWQTRTTITGTTETTYDIPLLAGHTGTGADEGKVYVRFVFSEGDAGTLVIDEAYAQAQQSGSLVGYSNGAIWVNTAASNTNTVPYVDGTADNPVSTWAAALTLSSTLGINRFKIAAASSITLTADSSEYELLGDGLWNLALGGQDVSNSYIQKASISGTASGSNAIVEDCLVNAGTTMGPAFFVRCGFNTTSGSKFTAASAGQYVFVDCVSTVAGSGTPYFNFAGTGGTTGVNFRRWSGGSNVSGDSNVTTTMEVVTGGGQTFAMGGGNVELRGICRAVTVTLAGSETVQIAAVTGPVTLSGTPTAATVNVYGVTSTVTASLAGATINNYSVSQATIDPLDATETQAAAAAAIAADKTGYKLAADGLDAIADPDDLTAGSVPATFTQKLRWLIQRFWRADKTPTQITVKSEAGNTITTQAVTDDQAGTETLGTPT